MGWAAIIITIVDWGLGARWPVFPLASAIKCMEHARLPEPDWRKRIVGLDQQVPLLDGRLVSYINLDNAASTPPLQDVLDALQQFLPYYASVHRGAGFKSRVSTTGL